MAPPDPLRLAAAAYAATHWDEWAWRQLGRDTGASDILDAHPRLYRSLNFDDPDYQDAAFGVLAGLLEEAVEPGSGEQGRMELIADSMPELPLWVTKEAPPRTRRLFANYLAERDASEIPAPWRLEKTEVDRPREESTNPSLPAASPAEPSPVSVLASKPTAPEPESNKPLQAPNFPAENPFVDDKITQSSKSIFIVHGHDIPSMDSIRVFVQREASILPISLAEEPGQGRTIIEKFESYGAKAAYVIVLLSPDDIGQTTGAFDAKEEPSLRARQNVVLELGYFIGKIGRENIVVMNAGVERPSDLAGLSYLEYPGENWMYALRNELVEAKII